jgi:hypothetical protein
MSDINLEALRTEVADYLCEVEPGIKEKAPGITQTETLMVVVCSLFQAAKELKQEKAEQAARIAELYLDLERTRNERNAAHVKARREIHAEYRDRIAELEARAITDDNGRMLDEVRDLIEGMEVSVDVSTGDHDASHRYFGIVSEVMDHTEGKHGVILLVQQDVQPNFDVTHPPTGDAAGKDSVDAARYRLLRSEECAKSLPHAYAPHDFRPIFGDELDAAIDAIASLTNKADGEKT